MASGRVPKIERIRADMIFGRFQVDSGPQRMLFSRPEYHASAFFMDLDGACSR